ncbi:MAG: type II toxin-antitoxin system RelE/ParE family toxin [Candidatus Omnitrophota bacterium]
MSNYTCYYFETGTGKSPVRDFIDSLDPATQRKFFVKVGWLEECGHRLPMPHARHLKDDIFELRLEGKEGAIRILYFFFNGNKIIFTSGFKKKTEKTPKKELKLAFERMRLYERGDKNEK